MSSASTYHHRLTCKSHSEWIILHYIWTGIIKNMHMWMGGTQTRVCWKLGDEGVRGGRLTNVDVFFLFFLSSLQSTYSRKVHNCWQVEMFLLVAIIKSDAGRYSDCWEKNFKGNEVTLSLHSPAIYWKYACESEKQLNIAIWISKLCML